LVMGVDGIAELPGYFNTADICHFTG
jgi:hypothetical protein